MGITHILVSHATPDATAAETVADHLRDAGHETKVDTYNLTLGDDTIAFMNTAIADAAVVIILYSKHSRSAKWQNLEINAAVWNEVAQDGGKCIVVRLDDTKLPPLLGPKVYGRFDPGDPASIKRLLESICDVLFREPTASSLVADAFRPHSQNPFRHLRAEFFENQPELHAKTFALPDAVKVGALEDMKPCILEGSRGTGKSMLLLSLRARNLLLRETSERGSPQRFGFYLKLTRGAICNAGTQLATDNAKATVNAALMDVAEQELILQIIESLFSELDYCVKRDLIDHDRSAETHLCDAAAALLFDSADRNVVSFDELHWRLAEVHKRLADFIRRRFIYQETVSVPIATLDLPQLKRVLHLVRSHIPSLSESMFIVLLDEYENLLPHQRRIVNSFVKLGPPQVSVKIAKKLAVGDVPGTTTGQELQEIHDYTRVALVYNLDDPGAKRSYHDLLRHVVGKMTALEGHRSIDVDALLPQFQDREIDEVLWLTEIAKLAKTTVQKLARMPDRQQAEKKTYYGEAATYRVLLDKRGRHAEKRFSGFHDLAFLGSGIIRYFQEFLSVGYYLSFGSGAPGVDDLAISPEHQSKAVHIVSQHNLTTLSRNVEQYGEDLKYFLLDLGDCLRYKLLRHSSEPEAARVTLDDPEVLQENAVTKLRLILEVGEREGVFQTKEGLPAFRPKHGSDPQPAEFNICRVYAPVLQVSPRLRWRTKVKCRHLQGLLEPGKRAQAVQELKRSVVRSRKTATDQDDLTLLPGG